MRSVWALVIGNIASVALRTTLTHVMLPGHNNRLMFDKDAAKEMFRFGRWLFVGTAMSFLSTQTDRLILGKITTLDTLGIYYIAATLASMPGQALGMLTWNVLFPALSRAFENNDDPAEFGMSPDDACVTIVPGAGVDPKDFPQTPEPDGPPIRIAVVSRMLKSKGIAEAVEAVRLARAAGAARRCRARWPASRRC